MREEARFRKTDEGESRIMKEYKVVNLNRDFHMAREKDLKQMEENINALVAEGWELQQVISPNDLGGVMIGIFFREKN